MSEQPATTQGGAAEILRIVRAARVSGTPDCYDGQRSLRRIKDGLQLEVTTDPASAGSTTVASMHDVSEGGVALWSRRAIAVRSIIYLREYSDDGRRPWLRARVKRCGRGLRGYFVGCVFEASARTVEGDGGPPPRSANGVAKPRVGLPNVVPRVRS
jgi:hypothetical protein